MQVTGFVPLQTPASQRSVCVQALPSLHVVPSVAIGFEQTPVVGSQTPATWHWSLAVHVTGLTPVQMPFSQVSTWVQALPSEHGVPFAFAGLEQTPVAGSQVPAS